MKRFISFGFAGVLVGFLLGLISASAFAPPGSFKLVRLSFLDPDQEMASYVRQCVRRADSYCDEVEAAIQNLNVTTTNLNRKLQLYEIARPFASSFAVFAILLGIGGIYYDVGSTRGVMTTVVLGAAASILRLTVLRKRS